MTSHDVGERLLEPVVTIFRPEPQVAMRGTALCVCSRVFWSFVLIQLSMLGVMSEEAF